MEVERSVRVLDGAVAIFDAVHGVQAQSETVWRQANRYHVPRIVYLNKMDRDGASLKRSIESIEEKLRAKPVVVQMPIGEGASFASVVDLITMEKVEWEGDFGDKVIRKKLSPEDGDVWESAKTFRSSMLEKLADEDEKLMEILLEEGENSND